MSRNKRNRHSAAANAGELCLTAKDTYPTESSELNHTVATAYFKKHLWAIGIITLMSLGALGAALKYLEEDARTQRKLAAKDRSVISSINPFIALPSPTPTPQLSKEYIYADSRPLAVEDKNANAAPPADLAIWRPGTQGVWWVQNPVTGSTWTTANWGTTGDTPVAGDFDGDGTTDFSVFRSSNSTWYVIHSNNSSTHSYAFGTTSDLVAPADYDGDGKTDEAVFRPSDGYWYIHASTAGYYTQEWGTNYDLPAPADYDGDGKADLAVWRTSDRKFYSRNSSNQSLQTIDTSFNPSGPTWVTVSGDYDGDGKADYGVYDSAHGKWYIRSSISGLFNSTVNWGESGDRAVQNDYDADGKVDIAVWRDGNGHWYILQSASNRSSLNIRSMRP